MLDSRERVRLAGLAPARATVRSAVMGTVADRVVGGVGTGADGGLVVAVPPASRSSPSPPARLSAPGSPASWSAPVLPVR